MQATDHSQVRVGHDSVGRRAQLQLILDTLRVFRPQHFMFGQVLLHPLKASFVLTDNQSLHQVLRI